MQKLNLPAFDYAVTRDDEGRVLIFDVLRRKHVVLTPEEWVRQHFVHFLLNELKYPKSLMKVEGGLQYNSLAKRSDIVVFNREGKPWMLVECKAPSQKIAAQVLRQASVYNATLRAKYLAVTNGIQHYCAAVDWLHNSVELISELPAFE